MTAVDTSPILEFCPSTYCCHFLNKKCVEISGSIQLFQIWLCDWPKSAGTYSFFKFCFVIGPNLKKRSVIGLKSQYVLYGTRPGTVPTADVTSRWPSMKLWLRRFTATKINIRVSIYLSHLQFHFQTLVSTFPSQIFAKIHHKTLTKCDFNTAELHDMIP